MVDDAKLAAHIKKLKDQDDFIRARGLASNDKREPFPLLMPNSLTRQRLSGGAEYRVNPRFRRDATEAEYVEFATLGYELHIAPREVFDFHWFGESLAMFKLIQIRGLPMMYTGWEALEQLHAVTSLVIENNPPVPLQLDNLPNLRHLGISGANVLSATRNQSLTQLGLGFRRLPKGLVIDPPLERLSMGMSGGDLDFSFLSDPTQLLDVRVSGAASVSLKHLAHSRRLKLLEVENCKELRDGGALVGLESLESVEFLGIRSVVDLDSLVGLRAKRIYVDRNYAFDPDFEKRAGGEDSGWYVEKYRGEPKRSTGVNANDDRTHHPFYVQSYAVTLFQVVFDEWDEYENLFRAGSIPDAELSDQLDFIAEGILREENPALLTSEGLYFDSDAEMMRIITPDENIATQIAALLAEAWKTPTRIRALARQTPKPV